MCWLCGASKGMDDDLNMSITHVDRSAPWWNTLGLSNPWSVDPNFSKIIGFEIGMRPPSLLEPWSFKALAGKFVESYTFTTGGVPQTYNQ